MTGLKTGDAVEVCPWRQEHPDKDLRELDGCPGEVRDIYKGDGKPALATVELTGASKDRRGTKDFEVGLLKQIDSARK
jgi:hypothetical protein